MRNLFSKLILSVLLSVALMPALSFAEGASIAVVDLDLVVSTSKKGTKVQKELQDELKKAQDKIDSKKSEFEKMVSSFEKQRASLSESARIQKEEDLIKTRRELERSAGDMQEGLNRKRDAALAEIYKDVVKAIENISQKEGYSLVLNKKNQLPIVLYSSGAIDISAAVTKALDSK